MYIEMNPTGLTLTDLICVARRKRSEDTGFPYAVQSCRCSNCRYVCEGKCSLEQIQTIDQSQLIEYMGEATVQEMNRIERASRISLGMQGVKRYE